jgi:hypothetical protein
MKRHGNLTEKTASAENIYEGWRASLKRKPKNRSRRRQAKEFRSHLAESLTEVQNIIMSGDWNVSEKDYGLFYRTQCGKLREICWDKVYRDNVLMHAVMQVDGKILTKSLIADTFSGIKGRGPTKGLHRMREYLCEYRDDEPIYCLKLDIRHFYDNIDREKLYSLIERKIKDERSLRIHRAGIMNCPGKGVPKGNLPSGTYSNFYLSPLDHYVKEQLGFRHYARYCDDIVVLSNDKQALKGLLVKITEFVTDYGLEIKPNVQIFPIERNGIDFMGYVFHRHETRLRKGIERSVRRAARKFKEDPSMKHYKSLAAYWGWVKHVTNPEALWNAIVGTPIKELLPKEEKAA